MFPSITTVPDEDEYTRKKRLAQGMLSSKPINKQNSVSQKLNLGINSSSSSTSEKHEFLGAGEAGSRLGSDMDDQGIGTNPFCYPTFSCLPQYVLATLSLVPTFMLFPLF